MYNNIKRICIFLLIFVVAISTTNFAHLTFKDSEYSSYDFENTYANFNKGPQTALNGDLLLLGDSFAFLCGAYCTYDLNYIVHQGYDVEHINIDFMEQIPYDKYKYAYLFIGPNDFMEQTNIYYFQRNLNEIIIKLKDRGMQVVMSNYLEPDYSNETCAILRFAQIPCPFYDYIIRDLVVINRLLYVDISDLFAQYGRMPGDFVHPHKDMYKPLMERVFKVVRQDIADKEALKINN